MAGESFTDIFNPVQNDYALISLRRVLGCTVDTIWKGTTCSDANMIATAAAFFNVAVAVVGSIFITYTIYVGVADTAREGEAMGGNSVKYTVARVGLGAIMILPVSSGFTLAQLLVIQILVWGSGAADNLWAKISPMIASGGYSQVATVPEDDYKLRGMIAGAIRTRAIGYVCAYRLNEIAEVFGQGSASGGSPIVARPITATGYGTITTTQTFADSGTWFNGSNTLCGSVQYTLASEVALQGQNNVWGNVETVTSAADAATWQVMNAIAVNAVNGGLNAAWGQIDASAKSIANMVYTQARNDAQVQTTIKQGVTAAQSALRNSVNSTLSGASGQIQNLAKEYLDQTAAAGWVFAISWQRANINIAQFFQNIVNGINFNFTVPVSLSSILQPLSTGFYGAQPRLTGSTWQVIAANYERDVGYMRSFDAFFADFGKATPSETAGQVGVPDSSAAGVSSAFRWVLSKLQVTGTNGTSQWSDPLLNLTQIGVGFVDAGLWALGGSVVSDIASGFNIPFVTGVLQRTASASWGLGIILVGAGFWIGGVLPLLPLVYFFGAVISWLVVGLEALIAVPIWVLTHFFPAREPSLIGASRQGYLLLFGLLARPILIIMGLVVSLLLMFAAFAILNSMFFSVFALMIPLDAGPVTSAITSVAAIVVYGIAATIVVSNSCALISELGDAALRWVEIGVQSLWSARFGSDVMQPVNPAAGVANVGRGIGSAAAGIRMAGHHGAQGSANLLSGAGARLRGMMGSAGGGGGSGDRTKG